MVNLAPQSNWPQNINNIPGSNGTLTNNVDVQRSSFHVQRYVVSVAFELRSFKDHACKIYIISWRGGYWTLTLLRSINSTQTLQIGMKGTEQCQ